MKCLLLCLLLSLCLHGLSQSVPNTNTFHLTDVTAVTGGTSLSAAFTNSVDAYFDATYKGSKDRLSNFRNYTVPVSCSLPSFISASCGSATYSTIEASATINSDGGCTVTSRGIQYSSDNTFNTILGSVTAPSGGTGQYYVTITGLTCGTTYYFRPWAINSVGTYYANSLIGSGCTTQTNNYSNIVLNNAITVSNCGFVGDFTASLTNAQTACQDFKDWADGMCTINGWTGFTVKAESLTVGKQTYAYNSCALRTDTGYYLYSPNTAARSIVYVLNGVIQSITACP